MFILLFSISFLFNILCILPYSRYIFKRVYAKYFDKPFFSEKNKDDIIISAIVKTSLNISRPIMIQQEYRGLFIDIKSFFSEKRNSSVFNNFYTSYLYVGLSQYALKFKDNIIFKHLEKTTNMWINEKEHKLNYKLQRIDQYPIGILFINLFRITNDIKYKKIADYIYNSLINKRSDNSNIIKYNNDECNYVDVLGMIVPFLMEYYELSGEILAYNIAKENLEEYYKYGVDKETGFPAHGYNLKSKIKVGSINWGRGIGWYLLANAYCSNTNIDNKILDNNLNKISYNQFLQQNTHYDSSTALMCEIYKQSKDLNRRLSLNFIRQHIRTNGYIDHCSGDTYGFNYYSNVFGESELCNGLFLILISKFNFPNI